MKQTAKRLTLLALCLALALPCGAMAGEAAIIEQYLQDRLAEITPAPTAEPTPTVKPTAAPTEAPTAAPTEKPTAAPTEVPTAAPTEKPTEAPTAAPTETPAAAPTLTPEPAASPAVTAEPTPSPAPTPEPTPPLRTLRDGSYGNDVTALQNALTEMGYFTGKVDGQFGRRTETALKKYQKDRGLKADGVLGADTRRCFAEDGHELPPYYAPVFPEGFERYLEYGMRGMDVRAMQEKLIEKGFMTGRADHIFGKKTRAAVKAFQQANDLKADGIAGPDTLFLLMD